MECHLQFWRVIWWVKWLGFIRKWNVMQLDRNHYFSSNKNCTQVLIGLWIINNRVYKIYIFIKLTINLYFSIMITYDIGVLTKFMNYWWFRTWQNYTNNFTFNMNESWKNLHSFVGIANYLCTININKNIFIWLTYL